MGTHEKWHGMTGYKKVEIVKKDKVEEKIHKLESPKILKDSCKSVNEIYNCDFCGNFNYSLCPIFFSLEAPLHDTFWVMFEFFVEIFKMAF